MFHCKECLYLTERKPNLQRHINNKHKKDSQQVENSEEKKDKFNCQKCNKNYKTQKGLLGHESKCKTILPDIPNKDMENNECKEKELGTISSKRIQDNSEVLLVYCDDKEGSSNDIQNKDKVIMIYNKADSQKYKDLIDKIKDIVNEVYSPEP